MQPPSPSGKNGRRTSATTTLCCFPRIPISSLFRPDGPLRQITIEQMRLLKERAQFKPLQGKRRVFLIDQIDRANEQAANSLLKTLEEPPEHLILLLTAENPYDLAAHHPLPRRAFPPGTALQRRDANLRRSARPLGYGAADRAGGRKPRDLRFPWISMSTMSAAAAMLALLQVGRGPRVLRRMGQAC